VKRKEGGRGDEGKEGGRKKKKTKHGTEKVGGAKRRAPDDDEEGGRRRKKRRVEETAPGPVQPRPKPTPAWKGAASSSRHGDTPGSTETPTVTEPGTGGRGTKTNMVRGVKGRKGLPGWRPATA
jgi:hypothetical protein